MSQHQSPQHPLQTGNSTLLIILKSLTEAIRILDLMLKEERIVEQKLAESFGHGVDPRQTGDRMHEFGHICERLWNLETMLSCDTRAAILMAAIDLEMAIVRFCQANLGNATTQAIASLALAAQLEVAHRALGIPEEFHDTPQYHALQALLTWRTMFEHGTMIDMPARSVQDQSLMSPGRFPQPGDEVYQLIEYMRHYLVVQHHLIQINEYPHLTRTIADLKEIEHRLNRIRAFQFKHGRLVGQSEAPA